MLISIYLPFSDYRTLMVPGFRRLAKPTWPFPDQGDGVHLRSIGAIRQRRKLGFEGWVGEDRLAFGVNALTVQLRRRDDAHQLGRLRLIRKACYFDGLTNGRIELLFGAEPPNIDKRAALQAAGYFLDLKARIAKGGFEGPLVSVPPALARLWADVTVSHGQPSHSEWVKTGRPVCIVECDQPLTPDRGSQQETEAVVQLALIARPRRTEVILIAPSRSIEPGGSDSRSQFRFAARYVRTYSLRLLQNAESLSLLFALPLAAIDDDRVQNLVNEYTRQINRSRQRMEPFRAADLVQYCYSAFERLYPGRIAALRVQLQNSNIRPNLVRKMLQFLDLSEAANLQVSGGINLGDGDMVQGDKVMGDKYENIDAKGQGIAIGRGATAKVTASSNNVDSIHTALASLADEVRKQSGRDDAETEATLVEAAAKKAGEGDEAGAAAILKKS
ncbi:hypothetical protein, partial [Bradyrhizobium sp. STM 3809]|uniref:hypothetical protein n=1 Tax=Bradyrhizobium sp. STM 3809 TaxID=551936 RepID=UPI00054DBC59